MSSTALIQVAQIIPCTEAEGPGRRFALWVQGCPLRCPGCCNPEMLSFTGGTAQSLEELQTAVESAVADGQVTGLTLLGGEPFAQAAGLAPLAEWAHGRGLSVMAFSGFTLAELRARTEPAAVRLLAALDILVDGPYRADLPETRRRWIGSTNQQIHFLTPRHAPDDPCWDQPNTLELRLADGVVTLNGFPALNSLGLWRRPPARR